MNALEIDHNTIDEDEVHENIVRWITFRLDKEIYGVEVEEVREILRIKEILPVPGTSNYVLGITNIRGHVVTVIDGRLRIGLNQEKQTDSSRMIVLESGSSVVAVIVDNILNILDIPESLVDSNPQMNVEESEFIKSVVIFENDFIISLNVQSFITSDNSKNLKHK